MTITVLGASITFNDGSVQTTAASIPMAVYQVGTYVTGRPQNGTQYVAGDIVSGVILYATSPAGSWRGGQCPPIWSAAAQVLINIGTWRCMAPAFASAGNGFAGLWIRIS